jgi:hypothetical protein
MAAHMTWGTATAIVGCPPGEEKYWGQPESKRVTFDGWDGLSKYEELARKSFEEGVANSLETYPPELDIRAKDGKLILVLQLRGLGDGDNGPIWHFSLTEALTGLDDDTGWETDAKIELYDALLALAQHVKEQITENSPPSNSPAVLVTPPTGEMGGEQGTGGPAQSAAQNAGDPAAAVPMNPKGD